MKSFLWIMLLVLSASSCTKEREELFTVRIAITDSLITYSDGRIIESVIRLNQKSYMIESLSDTLYVVRASVIDSQNYAGKTYSSRLIADIREDIPFRLLLMAAYTALRNQFNEIRLRWRIAGDKMMELPITTPRGYGITHRIEVSEYGIGISTYQHPIDDAPPDLPVVEESIPYTLPKDEPLREEENAVKKSPLSKEERGRKAKQAAAARAASAARSAPLALAAARKRSVNYSSQSPRLLIARKDGRLDIQTFRNELSWLSSEFSKIGYDGGRHFMIAVQDSTPASEFFAVAQAIIESIPLTPSIQKAALWDVAMPPPPQAPRGKFVYHNGLALAFRDLSFSLRRYEPVPSEDTTKFDESSRHQLLNLGGLFYSAITDTNTARMDKLLDYGFDINRYAFESLDVYTKGYSAINYYGIKHSYEFWEDRRGATQQIKDSLDWHGYTPLILAVSQNQPDVVRHLISRGADIQKPNKPVKTIRWNDASSPRNEYGAVRVPFTYGRTIRPLQLAIEKKNERIIKILQEAGAR